jgi:ABC-type multidrug transport system ATPase subunit
MISLTGARKLYGDTTVLDGATLNVGRGECVRITGAPQSGRTTLLRVIATLIRPTSGSLSIGGIDGLKDPVAARRMVWYVSPDAIAGTRLRVDEYLRWIAAMRGRKAPRSVTGIARSCGLDPAADIGRLTPPARATLAIAGSLAASADVLLLDDALGAIADSELRMRLADAIREARASGSTLIVASAGTDELSAMSSRILTLERGQLHEGLSSLRHQGEAAWAR